MFFVTCVFFILANQNLHESRLKSAPTRMSRMDASRIGSSLVDRAGRRKLSILDILPFARGSTCVVAFGIDCKATMMLRLSVSLLAATAVSAFSPSTLRPASTVRVTPSTSTAPTISSSTPSLFQPAWTSRSELCAMLQQTELPEKLYFPQEKEVPKVLGGLKIGLRELVVITGASSGLGLNCAVTLAKTGKYFVVMACRDVEKGKKGTLFHVRS